MGKEYVLGDAQDIAVIRSLGDDRFVYAVRPSLDVQKQFYDLSVSNPFYTKIPAFQKCWKFDEEKGIRGSSTYLALRFDRQALRPNGLWIPGLLEAKALDNRGKLENGVYRDYGIAVYSEGSPNKEIAKRLVPQARVLGLELPLIVPFRDMNYDIEKKDVKLSLVKSPSGLISGEEAVRELDSLDYKGNSGVQGLCRDGGLGLDAGDRDLAYSVGGGRVDWICGEATRAGLEHAHSALLERKYGEAMKEQEVFQESLIQ